MGGGKKRKLKKKRGKNKKIYVVVDTLDNNKIVFENYIEEVAEYLNTNVGTIYNNVKFGFLRDKRYLIEEKKLWEEYNN